MCHYLINYLLTNPIHCFVYFTLLSCSLSFTLAGNAFVAMKSTLPVVSIVCKEKEVAYLDGKLL